MERAPSECILCGDSKRSLLIEKDGWTVYRCSTCGLGVLDPRPDREELDRLYEKDYFDREYHEGLRAGSPEMKRRISQEDHRVRFFRRFKRKGLVVDIGCGMGYFLYAAREAGYRVMGVDISDFAASYVSGHLGIPMKTGHLDTITLPESSVDVVTMWHFLEHTDDPRHYIEKVARWLKPDGLLVIDVPNYEGTDAQKTWEQWTAWQLPYHYFQFTPQTLTRLLSRHGFEIIRSKDYHSDVIKERLRGIPVVSLFARLIAKAYSGTSYAVVARKKSR
jgi:2-polyprenyl-3-methyl-5-hydroxy-6-metoxy-1,4-benzoquinol methylase